MIKILNEYLNRKRIERYDRKVDQIIAEQLKGSLIIEGDKVFRWTRVETGFWIFKSAKLVKIYE